MCRHRYRSVSPTKKHFLLKKHSTSFLSFVFNPFRSFICLFSFVRRQSRSLAKRGNNAYKNPNCSFQIHLRQDLFLFLPCSSLDYEKSERNIGSQTMNRGGRKVEVVIKTKRVYNVSSRVVPPSYIKLVCFSLVTSFWCKYVIQIGMLFRKKKKKIPKLGNILKHFKR